MTRVRKIILLAAILVLAAFVWIAYGIIHTVQHIPEAYAAWDTGTLLVEYMKTHENHWPTSWDNLLTVMDSDAGHKILLRGAGAGDQKYAQSLRDKASVDWSFDPAHNDLRNPVTLLNGGSFSVLWQGADPNEMVHTYLREQASTQPTEAR
ncbi:MAG TPA: hypothetical protein VHS31_08380 [Tepidisphaeraceae bacterium]|jgi:hypothetical protein|nr:hypothetical protein [Tepidisphaeraceae bacterium]